MVRFEGADLRGEGDAGRARVPGADPQVRLCLERGLEVAERWRQVREQRRTRELEKHAASGYQVMALNYASDRSAGEFEPCSERFELAPGLRRLCRISGG